METCEEAIALLKSSGLVARRGQICYGKYAFLVASGVEMIGKIEGLLDSVVVVRENNRWVTINESSTKQREIQEFGHLDDAVKKAAQLVQENRQHRESRQSLNEL